MNLLEAITQAHLLAQGKAVAPANTTSKYATFKGMANVVQTMWQDEPDVQWDSLRFIAEITPVTATDTFTLPTTVREVSYNPNDQVYIEHTDGNKTYYDLVEPDELQKYTRNNMMAVSHDGTNLVFSRAFTADDAQFGGTINIPAYGYVNVLSDDADELVVDDPLYATLMMAAEYCRVKTSLVYRVDGLVERASQIMQKMKQNQSGAISSAYRENLTQGRTW